MSKSKSSTKAAKPAKSDVLTKAKDAAITKPAQKVKSKSKELAKQVAEKEDKKSKKNKKVKEPTPEPSESEDSDSSESESSGSENEVKTKPVANGKANGVKKPAPKAQSSDSEESASDSDSSEDEAPKANGASKKVEATAPKAADSSDEDDSDSDESMRDAEPATAKAALGNADSSDDSESSEDEKPAKKATSKTTEVKKSAKNEPESEADSDDESDSSEESDEEKEATAKSTKRKAEDEADQIVKKTKTDVTDTSKGSNLFVGNLSWNVDDAWLKEVFEEFGEVSGARLMTDRATGRSKGFGYVDFVNAEDAAKAHAAKQGAELDGRPLNVDFANARPDNSQKQDNRRKSYGDQVGEPSDTLFLGNLSFEVGQEAVTEAFQPHGTILGIRLPTDRETGQPKGFGYVTFASTEEATTALGAMQGAYIEGRPIRLDYSSPRPQNDSPARGRGGFGGGRGGPRGGARGGRGGRGGGFGSRGGRGGGRGGSTNRGGFGDFSGKKTSFD